MEFVRWRCAARPGFKTTSLRPLRCLVLRDTPLRPAAGMLKEAGFDAFVEDLCKPYYAPRMGAPSLPPGRYFDAHGRLFRGYRQRARHLLALFGFAVASRVPAPGEPRLPIIPGCRRHARACRTRSNEKVFGWVLSLVAERGLVKGERIVDGFDDGSQRCPADDRAARQRRDLLLTQMAKESGVETRRSTTWSGWIASGRARNSRTRIGRARPIRMRRSRG